MKNLLLTLIAAFLTVGMFAQTDILPPQLNAPSDEDDDQMPDVELDWYPSGGIGEVSYEVNLDTNSTFSNPQVFTTNNSAQLMNELMFGTQYFWRVRATDDNGTSDWSETRSFLTFYSLTLDSPDDGDIDIEPKAELKWKAKFGAAFITGITHYDYEVAYDEEFTNMFISSSVAEGTYPSSTFYYAYPQLLRFDTTYYWRVRARHNSDQSDWSEVWSFHTLVAPTNDSPSNGATDQMINATLEWGPIEGAYEYIYELCTDPNFASPCMTLADTNIVEATGLMFGTTYYWRAQAMHTADTSEYSETWSFETINTVYLESPENGDYIQDNFPTLTWEALTGISGYQLMFADNETFENAELVQVGASSNSHLISVLLEQDIPHYWKVRSYENGDTTNWSEVWSFIIGEQPEGINNTFAGGLVSIHPNPTNGTVYLNLNPTKSVATTISVLNMTGQIAVEEEVSFAPGSGKYNLDLSSLENGLYLMRLRSGDETFTRKILLDK